MGFFALLTYVIVFIARPHEWGNEVREIPIIQVTLLSCLAFFLFLRDKNLAAPQLLLLLLLTFIVAFSVLVNGWAGGAVLQGEDFIRTVLIPFILISAFTNTRTKQYVLFATMVACAALMVWNGHAQITNPNGIGILGNPVLEEGANLRIRSFGYFSDPNDLGMLFVMMLPVILLLEKNSPGIIKPILWLGILLFLYGIYLTNSRGTLLATLSLPALWYWRKYKLYKTLFLGGLLSPVLLFIMSTFRTISAEEESAYGRLEAWYAGYQMLQSNPLFGVGHGFFTDYHDFTAHNSFVLAFAELGLIGCLIWVAILVVTILGLSNVAAGSFIPQEQDAVITKKQRYEALQESGIAVALLYSLVGYMACAFFLSRTYVPLLYMFLAMATACIHRTSLIFPKPKNIYDYKRSAKWTFGITISGILGVNLLLKVFL